MCKNGDRDKKRDSDLQGVFIITGSSWAVRTQYRLCNGAPVSLAPQHFPAIVVRV